MTTDTVIEKKTTTTRRIKEPGKFKVVVCNDDVTPVEFVITMLIAIFKHEEQHALQLTRQIHNNGSAVVGTYSFEIAEQKAVDGINMARANGFPLVIKVEAE
jgi:ATP-dependent Clp protease adaptor protein ClpS